MKKTFLAKRNALLAFFRTSVGAGALGVVVFLALVRLVAPNLFWTVLSPVVRTANFVTERTTTFANSVGNATTVTRMNEELTAENAVLRAENLTLKEQVNDVSAFANSRTARTMLAGVLTRPPQSPYDVLILAAGTNSGVRVGMGAFGPGGVPLGVVERVSDDFSHLVLFSAPGRRTNGWVGPNNVPLTLEGAGGGTFRVTLPKTASTSPGDTVFVSGPGKLPIGTVIRIDGDPSSPSVELRIAPLANLFSLTWVELRAIGDQNTVTSSSRP